MSELPTPGPLESALRRVEVGLQIDVEGRLNPSIFLPEWFDQEGLLRQGEVREAAESLNQDEDYVFFRTQDLALEVTREKLRLYSVHQGLQLTYRDLVLNMFTLLRHTPIDRLRIIRFEHFTPPAETQQQPAWKTIANAGLWAGLIQSPVFSGLSVEGNGPGGSHTMVTIEPSRLEEARVFVACSYAYDLHPLPGTDGTTSEALRATLKDEWDEVDEHSKQIFSRTQELLFGSHLENTGPAN